MKILVTKGKKNRTTPILAWNKKRINPRVVLSRPFVEILFVFLSLPLSSSHSALRRCSRGRLSILSCRCFRSEGILQQPVECDKAQGVAVVINSYYPLSRPYILYVRTDDDNVPSSSSSCGSSVPREMPFVKQQCILNA